MAHSVLLGATVLEAIPMQSELQASGDLYPISGASLSHRGNRSWVELSTSRESQT